MGVAESGSASVTAAHLVRSFAECRDRAREQPLFISSHGRQTHVLMGVEQFEAMQASAQPGGPTDQGALTEQTNELARWIDDAVIICDEGQKVRYANRVAHAICRKSAEEMSNLPLLDALPEARGTLLETHFRRTMVSAKPSSADVPSPFVAGAWLRIQTFPLCSNNVIVFRDISEEVQYQRLVNLKTALDEAMILHGQIAYLRVSMRGTVDYAASISQVIGLPEQRLLNLPVLDLVTREARPAFRSALDEVLRGEPARRIETELLTNDGTAATVMVAITPLHGAHGDEGAILLMTRI